ncbi:MAG TPA: GGDEF domain-containing protein [Bacilli bacterium]|nr:GGDEF domain-containing protein [Bacilli bacterium]
MKQSNLKIPIITMGIFFLILTFFSLLNVHNHKFDFSDYQFLNEDWTHGTQTIEKLPIDLDAPVGEFVSISKALPEDFNKTKTILIRTSLQDIIVKLDDVIIYEHIHEEIGQISSYASLYHMVSIPAHSSGKTLEISTSSPYEAMSGRMNAIVYGTTAELNYYLITTFGLRFLIGLVALLVGILLVVISIIAFGKVSEASSLMGMVAFFLGLWILAESRILQFVIGQSLIIGSLAYLSLIFIPLAISYYIQNYVLIEYKKTIMRGLVILYCLNGVFVIASHLTGFMDFFETVVVTQALIVLGILVVTPLLWKYIKKQESKDVKKYIYMGAFIALIGILELINFLFDNYDQTSVYVVAGLGLIMIYQLISYVKNILKKIRQGYEKEIYERLAYLDPLTKAKNRLAFNEQIKRLFENPEELNKLAIIYFDLNELKKINDTEGHLEGDKALIEIYDRINHIYGAFGDVYRIGGDEFVFMSTLIEQAQLINLNTMFDQYMIDKNNSSKYNLMISYGITFYDETSDKTPKDIITRADRAMYDNKPYYVRTSSK